MSAPAGEPELAPTGAAAAPSTDRQPWDWVRYAVAVGWLSLLVATVLTGFRASTWSALQTRVADGDVDRVQVVGELPAGATGYGVVEVRWRRGPLGYSAQVVQVRGPGQAAEAQKAAGATPVVHAPPSTLLTHVSPGLTVTREPRAPLGGPLLGWFVPPGVMVATLLLTLAGLALLGAAPRLWRVTRWGWFWLLLTPIGQVAFALLSGPTPGLPTPRDARRRMSGGWAFLVTLVLVTPLVY